ncbi:MAG: hypothetical protein KC503_12090 [Myxococcales bacterium]|nr:hypothetical protein [Myxococcales bacterium]
MLRTLTHLFTLLALLAPVHAAAAGDSSSNSVRRSRTQLVKIARTSLRRLAANGYTPHRPRVLGMYAGAGDVVTQGGKVFLGLGRTCGLDALLVDRNGNLHTGKLDARQRITTIKRISVLKAIGSMHDGALFDAIIDHSRLDKRTSRLAQLGKGFETSVRYHYLSRTLQQLGSKPNVIAIQSLLKDTGPAHLLSDASGRMLSIDSKGQLFVNEHGRLFDARAISVAHATAIFGSHAIRGAITRLDMRAESFVLMPIDRLGRRARDDRRSTDDRREPLRRR